MPVQVSKVTHNNSGHFYRIAIDIAKEGAEVWDLTPYFKGRVGDDNFGLQIVWYYQGRLLDVTNKTPYIKGNVGHYSFDEKKNLQMAPDADVVTSHGKPSDCQANGQATYYFPQQMFPTDGIFKGFIGLEDENQNLTGVDIWFRVLPGVARMGHACDVYVDVLDKTIADFKEKIRQQSIDFDAALQLELQKEKDLIQQKLDAASGAIDEDTAALKKLAAAVGAIQAQIDAGDVVTLKKHNDDYDDLRRDQAALSKQIVNDLSKISMNVKSFANLAALQSAFPNGAEGVYVTLDDKHGHIWDNGAWQDTGVFVSGGLSDATKTKIANSVTGLTNIYQLDQLVPPYDDLYTIPINSVVTYSVDVTKIKHIPDNISTFTAMRIGFDSGNPSGSATILIDNQGRLYSSYTQGDAGAYTHTPWVAAKTNRNNRNIYQENQVVAPYNDLHTIPANSTVLYSIDVTKIKNTPEVDQIGLGAILVQTTSFDDDSMSGGHIDVIEIGTGRQWRCQVTGVPGAYYYTNWTYVESEAKNRNIYQLNQLVAPYDDLNTLPADSKVLYSVDATKIKNFPSGYNFGTSFVQTESFSESTKSGGRQLITNYDGREAVRFITGVEGNYSFTPWQVFSFENIESYLEPSLSMFEHFAVIGDSYGSGTLFFDDKWGGNDNLQWGLMLAKKYGTTYTRLTIGGISTRTWLTDEQGLKKLNSSDPQDIYYLCLGINDESILEKDASYLGSVADIDNGSDTFYGNYGKIIKAIQAKAPRAKIILFGLAQNIALYPQITMAIKNIADYFHVPYQDLDDPLFTSSYYLNQSGGHPVGPVYGAMAEAYARLIKKCVITNQDYFRRYGWQD